MKFSVLMSVYKNDEIEYLKQALSSIYDDQTLKPDQIVIVIDGPISSELNLVLSDFYEAHKDIVTLIPLKKNVGLGEALHYGTAYCKYDYIFRMDSDDICNKFRFEKQVKYLLKHPEVDVLGSNISEFQKSLDEQMLVRVVPEKNDEIVQLAKKRNPMNHVTVCMKKSALEKCGGYESLLLLEDYYLWLKMIARGSNLANLNESLVYVRVGNGFVSKRGSKTRIVGWKKLQQFMVENNMINNYEAIINMFYINIFVHTPSWIKALLYRYLLRESV